MRIKTLLLAFALAFLLTVPEIIAQDEGIPVSVLTMMSTEDAEEYLNVEAELWKPVHANRVREGKILGWYVYQVVNAMDGSHDYNYMTVEVYPNWASLEAPYDDVDRAFQEVHGTDAEQSMFERTEASRTMKRQEMWVRQKYLAADDAGPSTIKYIVVDWMDVHPGKMEAYMNMEESYYMPVHQKRVDGGHIKSWSLYAKMGYSEVPGSVDAATTATYASWQDMWDSYPADAWDEAHPGASADAVYDRMRKTRAMTGSTIYKLVDYVNEETAKLGDE